MKELAARYLDGTATDAEVMELSARLRTDPLARDEYLRLAAIHARLATDPALWVEHQPAARPLRWLGWRPLTAAAAIVVLMAVMFWRRETAPAVPVATLLRTEDAVWAGQAPLEGGRLVTGPLRLLNGRAMLRLDGGAALLLRGEVELRLDDGGSVTLLAGEVRAEVPEAAVGFTIHTPGGKVVDLGTEFIASVNREGQTEVSVVQGEVEVPDGDGVVHRLTTGKALALDRRGTTHPITARLVDNSWQPWAKDEKDALRAGRLLLHETFDYPAGDHDPADLQGGSGWAGPWTIFQGKHADQPWSAKMHQMEMGTFEGRKAWVSPVGKTRCQRMLAQPLSMKEDAVRYVSLMWFEEALPPEQRAFDFWPMANLMIDLRGASDSGPGQRVGLRTNYLMHPIIESGAGQGFESRVRVAEGRRLMMVGKILSRREGEDEVFLRVFEAGEPPGPVEPDSWDVVTRGLRLDAVLDRVVLESIGPKPRRIEEIRIGTTWRDVVAGWDAGMKLHP
ncbi:MAG: FecR domain-containing protein [Verrucomicrobia bacterium]|nr:FecR domain-containing protein [Verrucomicrobiota bacterium]